MVHYKPVKVTIDVSSQAEVLLNIVFWHHDLPNSIVINKGLLFTAKFWSLLHYFFGVKRRLTTTFHPQTDGWTKQQNNTLEVYPRAFINFKQNDWARFLPIAEFTYNNTKNASTSHASFKLNCNYHLQMSYKEEVDPRSQSKSLDGLLAELRELMIVCRKTLHYIQKFQKHAHDKEVKSQSYILSKIVWLNSKYIKTKLNWKLETKFFGPFQMLHSIEKQAYKLKLFKKRRIDDIFHMSLLE